MDAAMMHRSGDTLIDPVVVATILFGVVMAAVLATVV